MHAFFASCIPGTEGALCEELRELGLPSVRLNRGGIPFRGTMREGWRACLESRIAQQILWLVGRFEAPDEAALYAGIRGAMDWTRIVGPAQTLAVEAVTRASGLRHAGFVALKAKDAVVDAVRASEGARPSVDREDPDVRVFVYLLKDRCSLYLQLGGEPLHKRGYRQETGDAPLRETLAAAMLRLSGWDGQMPLIDPFCGSGTIAIEAALWASRRAPGLFRERFGFERWRGFDESALAALRELEGSLRADARGSSPRIQAADLDPAALDAARANARRAGVRLAFRARNALDWENGGQPMYVVSNPPYGRRLARDEAFSRKLAAAVTRWHGCRVALLVADPGWTARVALAPAAEFPLKNGDLDCSLVVFDVP